MRSPIKQNTQFSVVHLVLVDELKRTETLEGDRLRRLLARELLEGKE